MTTQGSSNSLWSKWQARLKVLSLSLFQLPFRTCNVLRTAMTRIRAIILYTSNLFGRLSRCLVRPGGIDSFSFTDTLIPDSRRNALLVQPLPSLLISFHCMTGFLPILYNWLKTRWQTAPVQLPSETSNKHDPESLPLTGWKVLLLWIPAACDLTGTTVSIFLGFC